MTDSAFLDDSVVTRRPLVLMLSEHGPAQNADPRSTVDQFGAVTNAWDWAIESADALGDHHGRIEAFVTSYVLPIDDQLFMLGYSIGGLPELVVHLIRDPASGNRAARLVQQHLPNLWSALRNGAGLPDGHGLIRVRTDSDYWFFGGLLQSRSPTSVDLDDEQVKRVRTMAMDVLGEALGLPGNLPGILDVLPPDRRRQQLEAAASIFDGIADALDHAKDILR